MKKLFTIVFAILATFTAQQAVAGFITGVVVGSMLAGGSSKSKVVKIPCTKPLQAILSQYHTTCKLDTREDRPGGYDCQQIDDPSQFKYHRPVKSIVILENEQPFTYKSPVASVGYCTDPVIYAKTHFQLLCDEGKCIDPFHGKQWDATIRRDNKWYETEDRAGRNALISIGVIILLVIFIVVLVERMRSSD